MTAVANEIWTAAQFNTYVRDNLNASETATVSAAGQYLVSTAANTLAARTPTSAVVATSETTASTSYANLATTGPTVTVTTGTSVLLHIAANMSNNTADAFSVMGFEVSGASTLAAADETAVYNDGVGTTDPMRFGVWQHVTGLTSGSNTFTAKYKVQTGTATFSSRELVVIPL